MWTRAWICLGLVILPSLLPPPLPLSQISSDKRRNLSMLISGNPSISESKRNPHSRSNNVVLFALMQVRAHTVCPDQFWEEDKLLSYWKNQYLIMWKSYLGARCFLLWLFTIIRWESRAAVHRIWQYELRVQLYSEWVFWMRQLCLHTLCQAYIWICF